VWCSRTVESLLEGLAEGLKGGSETWEMTSQTCGRKTDQVLRLTTSTVLHSLNNTGVPCTKLRVKDLYLQLLHHYYILTKFLRHFEVLVRDWALLFVKQSTSITHTFLKQAILPALGSLLPNFATSGGLNVCTCVCVIVCVCQATTWLAVCLTRYCLQNSGKLAITNGQVCRFAQTCDGPDSLR